MAMFDFRGMGSNLWNLAKWGATGSRAAPWLKGGGALLGAGGVLGMMNPDRSAVSGMGTTLGTTVRGAMTGGFLGAAGGAGMMGLNAYRGGLGATKSAMRWIGAGAGKWGMRGAAIGGALGAGFGLLKSGVTSNRPVNRIRGLHQ